MANISNDAVINLINYLGILGIARELCFEAIELSPRQLNQRNLVNIDKYIKLYQLANSHLNIDDLGFKYGQQVDASRWGILGMIAASSSNLLQALQCQTQYQSITGSLGTPSFTLENDTLMLTWQAAGDYPHHIAEELITSWVEFARRVTCLPISPIKVWFAHRNHLDKAAYQKYFGCPVLFEQASSGLLVSADIINLDCTSANPELNKTLQQYAKSQVHQYSTHNPVAVVKDYILSQLPKQQPSLKQIANFLSTSERTLQRRLMDYDCSIKQLIDETKKDIAINYIVNSQLSMQDIATMLGFSEQSAFHRAFKRWTNLAPSLYREKHQIIHF